MARKLPEQNIPTASPARIAEILDELLANRPGWESTDAGWTHKKSGITVTAGIGVHAFHVTCRGSASEVTFSTRTALDLHLAGAKA